MKTAPHLLGLISLLVCSAAAQIVPPSSRRVQPTATVEVLVFTTDGRYLDTPTVELFESFDHQNLEAKFHDGVAEGIPYGSYRVRGNVSGYYNTEERQVSIYGQRVTLVLGATSLSMATRPEEFHGHVIGPLPPGKKSYAKLTGIYSSGSIESAIGPDGDFEMVGMPRGLYLLLILSENRILASSLVSLPYPGGAISQIRIGQDRAILGF
jgi:hypothetical protein